MKARRLLQTIRLWTIRGSAARTAYLKDKHIFASIGSNCSIMDRIVPLYANLIKLGNNVHLASNVTFLTHDITHIVVKKLYKYPGGAVQERIGCIEVLDNVFIGSGSKIMYDVRIGPNAIVAAGSVVTRDVPEGCIVAGVPARTVGSFRDFLEKRMNEELYPPGLKPKNQEISAELAAFCWTKFEEERKCTATQA